MKINKQKTIVYFVHFMIGVLHLILLYWMIYVLKEGGKLTMEAIIYHFIGMSIFGGLLIRCSALVIKKLTLNNFYPSHRINKL
jgi:apolipoprotein N-acyltransferase